MPVKKRRAAVRKKAATKIVKINAYHPGSHGKGARTWGTAGTPQALRLHPRVQHGILWAVFVSATIIGAIAFIDAAYLSSVPYAVMGSTGYGMQLAAAGSGMATSTSYRLGMSFGEAAAGQATSTGYSVVLGSMAYLGGDSDAPKCTLSQSTGTPALGAAVILTAACTDDVGLSKIELATDENGNMTRTGLYGSPAAASGTSFSTDFRWLNPATPVGRTVSWKVFATDTSYNEGGSSTLAFTVGAEPDTVKPRIGSIIINPPSPSVGTSTGISAEATDNNGLAAATLTVNGIATSAVSLSGKAANPQFTWTPAQTGTYRLKISVTDGAGNTADSNEAIVGVGVPVVQCTSAKPADTEGPCTDDGNGKQQKSVTTWSCNTENGQWKSTLSLQDCATGGNQSADFTAIGLVAAAVAAGAGYYILKIRKKGGPELPSAPAPEPA
ncbi:MAG: LPXTG cell wall anchor domain-containing protein [Candidatus Aenigmatarchaeota archaeon]